MRTIKQNLRLSKKDFNRLFEYTKRTNSLYNCCLYEIKLHYESTGKYIGYGPLDKLMQSNEHYQSIPSFNAQQIVRLADKSYRVFFALLKRKNAGKYAGNVNTPKYRKSGGNFILIFDNTRVYLKNNKLKLYKDLKLTFTYQVDNIKKTIIKSTGYNFMIYISYENEVKPRKEDNGKYLTIDFGVSNLTSCVSNIGQSFIINGRPLKSINQLYNKRKSQLQSELEKKNCKKWSKQLSILTGKRQKRIDHYFYSSISKIVNWCINNSVNTIVLGYNKGWKQNCNIGKINNQNFSYIPYDGFRQKLESKCESLGLNLIIVDESFTSKTSFIDNELPVAHDVYLGKRISRGLFKTTYGCLVNADCNAAAQILAKHVVLNREERDRIGAVIVTPSKFNIL